MTNIIKITVVTFLALAVADPKQYRDLRTGIWIWDASGFCGFIMLLAGV
jgi:hypothetical protein